MMTDFLIAYWLHSTALLAAAWCLMKIARPRSSVVRERLWKLAAVLPMLTALTSGGFRSAKVIPVAERQATIVEAIASPKVAELASDDSVNRVVPQAVSAADPIVSEVIDNEHQAVEPVAPLNVADSDSTVELVDQSFEPVVRFESSGDEMLREARVELDEAHQQPQVDNVLITQTSVATSHAEGMAPMSQSVSVNPQTTDADEFGTDLSA